MRVKIQLQKKKTAICDVVKENSKTIWVRLPDNRIIKRHRTKDVIEEIN